MLIVIHFQISLKLDWNISSAVSYIKYDPGINLFWSIFKGMVKASKISMIIGRNILVE